MGILTELTERPWLRSWKLLLVLSSVYLVSMSAFALLVLLTVDEEQGHAAGFAAMAAMLLVGVALVAYVVALVAVVLLKRDIAKPLVAIFLILGGTFTFTASGLFEGFFPLFAISLGVGLLALYESFS